MLNTIDVDENHYQADVSNLTDTLESFDTFKMRRSIQCYTIEWNPSARATCDPNAYVDSSIVILNKIFFQDYDKHPLLKKVKIIFDDDRHLFYLAKLLYYFNQHYKQLFVERRLYLKHFQLIDVGVKSLLMFENHDQLIESFTDNNDTRECGDMSIMFDQTSNKEYPVDKKVIEIEDVNQG